MRRPKIDGKACQAKSFENENIFTTSLLYFFIQFRMRRTSTHIDTHGKHQLTLSPNVVTNICAIFACWASEQWFWTRSRTLARTHSEHLRSSQVTSIDKMTGYGEVTNAASLIASITLRNVTFDVSV